MNLTKTQKLPFLNEISVPEHTGQRNKGSKSTENGPGPQITQGYSGDTELVSFEHQLGSITVKWQKAKSACAAPQVVPGFAAAHSVHCQQSHLCKAHSALTPAVQKFAQLLAMLLECKFSTETTSSFLLATTLLTSWPWQEKECLQLWGW